MSSPPRPPRSSPPAAARTNEPSSPPRGTSVAERVAYRLLLSLYPRAFRRAYGRELRQTFEAQRQEERYRGAAGAIAFWGDMLADLGTSIARVRAAAIAHRIERRRERRAIDAALARSCPRRSDERSRVDVMLHDLRYSLRLLARRPGFTAVAVLSLALGLGGTSLVFGLVDGLVLKPFAYPDSDRLVAIGVRFPKLNDADDRFIEALSPAELVDIRRLRTLTRVQAFDLANRHVSGGDQPERLFTALVFGDLFETIGVRPLVGRGFTADELAPGGRPAAVLSHRIWRTRFNADPAIVGRAIRVNGVATPVVGIMPPEVLVLGTDLWLPLRATPDSWPRNERMLTILARLAPGATLTQANAELAALASQTAATFGGQSTSASRPTAGSGSGSGSDSGRAPQTSASSGTAQFPEYQGWRLTAAPWAAALTRSLRPTAFLLLGAVVFVVLIVCVNIANLQLARASTRQREMAVRMALGAGHWRVGRQLLVESLLLAVAGSALGLIVAIFGLRVARSLLPAQILALDPRVQFSGRVLLVSIAAALASAVLIGVLPALRAMRTDPFDSLRHDSRQASPAASTQRLRYGLIVAEIALAMVLSIGAGLLIRTMLHLSRMQPGIDIDRVLTMRLTLPREKYDGPAVVAFFDRLVERVQTIPGVRAASVATQFPPGVFFTGRLGFDGRTTAPGDALPKSDLTMVGPGLFRTLGIPLRAGRTFEPTDDERTPGVAVVNETFARRFFPGVLPIGRRVAAAEDPGAPWFTIVGVVGDTRGRGLMQVPQPELYVSVRQMGAAAWNQLFLLVRTEGDPRALLPSVRREIAALDRDQPAYMIQTLEEAFATSLFAQRLLARLLALFAALAVTLAAVGIYAVMSYAVAARTQEIGIRIALGAGARTVMGMVVRQVLWLVAIGVAIGLAGALALGRLATSVLVGTAPGDPLTLTAVALLLGAVALIAGYLPARRASRVDPVVALRVE